MIAHLKLPFPYAARIALSFYKGVPIFFIISGFLIWLSIGRSSSYVDFIRKRFWRIYPELWCAVAVDILSIVLLYKGWNLKDLLTFTFTQGTILQFWTPDSLRGYGCGTPNGALWTMCVMIQFYIVSWLIYKILHKQSVLVWIITLLFFIGISFAGQEVFKSIGVEVLTKLYGQTIIRHGWLFCCGCFIAEHKEKIVDTYLSKYWYVLLIVALMPYLTRFDVNAGYNVLHSVLLVSGLIGFAHAFPNLSLTTDISYGIFLYHMIVVNIFMTVGWMQSWGYAITIMVITIVLAYVSSRTIGTWSAKRRVLSPNTVSK